MLYFTCFTPEVPPTQYPTNTPPLGGGTLRLSGKYTPRTRVGRTNTEGSLPPREVLRAPPPRGGVWGEGKIS